MNASYPSDKGPVEIYITYGSLVSAPGVVIVPLTFEATSTIVRFTVILPFTVKFGAEGIFCRFVVL